MRTRLGQGRADGTSRVRVGKGPLAGSAAWIQEVDMAQSRWSPPRLIWIAVVAAVLAIIVAEVILSGGSGGGPGGGY